VLKPSDRALAPCKADGLHLGPARTDWATSKEGVFRLVLWTVLALLVLTTAFLADGQIAHLLKLRSAGVWETIAIYSSKAGEGWVVALVGAAACLGLFFGRRFEASRMVLLIAMTGLLTGGAATVVRSLLGRTRPGSQEVQGFYGIWHDSHWIIGKYEFGSFPSGHAATVIGLAAAAWLLDRRLGALAIVYALLVSWSRMALGCHHFSDEVAAALLGIYGARLILIRLGPAVYCFVQQLQDAWVARRGRAQRAP
jgi:membrane-associated phospholipid phosphatase